MPGATGPTKFRLKAEKESEAYVWLAVMTQSNKVREKKAVGGKGSKGGKDKQKLETLSESYDDYEI